MNGGDERDAKDWGDDGDDSDIHCEPGVGLSNTGEGGNIGPGPQLNSVSLVSGWNWGSLIGDENGESMSSLGPAVKISSADSLFTDMVASSSSIVVSELGQELALGERLWLFQHMLLCCDRNLQCLTCLFAENLTDLTGWLVSIGFNLL